MAVLLSAYFQIEEMINNNKKLAALLEALFEESSSTVVLIEDITNHFPYPTFLVHTWNGLLSFLESFEDQPSTLLQGLKINDKYLFRCLYATIMMEDERGYEESPVLSALTTCLKIGMLRSNDEFTKEECLKVLLTGLKKVHTRDLVGWNVSSEFMFNCLQAIKTMNMDSSLIIALINMLMIYAGKHYDMVTNLSLADSKSPCGLLAFACLANLFIKNCEDKQSIMETMLEHIEYEMENNSGLTSFQINVKQSNFRVMIRQVGSALNNYTDHLLFAVLRVAERHPKSKSLVFIVNQLPYALFCQFSKVVVALCTRSYYQQMQMFSFNMLESPYITEDEDEMQNLEKIYEQITISMVLPLTSFDQQHVTETIKVIYAALQIQNGFVRNILLKMTKEHTIMKDVMTYINQYCSSSWKQEHKMMNQTFILVYCRLLILNNDMAYDKQLINFSALVMNATISDLHPCINDFKALYDSEAFKVKEVQSVLINGLANVTKLMVPHTIAFLRFLHNIIFDDLRVGVDYYNLLALKTPECHLVLKNMEHSKLITQRDVENLSIMCQHLIGWRLMSDLVLHMDIVLNKHILHFTEHLHKLRAKILMDTTLMYVTRFFSETLDRRSKICPKNDKEILLRFAVFLEGALINRTVSINSLPLALLTIKKYHTFFNHSLVRLQAMNLEVEDKTREAFEIMTKTKGNFSLIQVLTRDIHYFGEMQMVFADLPEFTPVGATKSAIEAGIESIPKLNRNFPTLACSMIRCMTQFSIRHETMLKSCLNSIEDLLKSPGPEVKEVCLDCLYDIALFRTSSYEVLIPHLYDLFTTNNPLDSVKALSMYAKLFAKDHTIPNDWQTFVIALAIGNDDVTKLIEPSILKSFIQKLNPYFETYFIHIMLYSNDICDYEDHILLPEYKEKIISEPLSVERRHKLYSIMTKYFRPESRAKVLNYIYKQLAQEYLKPGELEGLLEDIFVVTFDFLKVGDYPELSRDYYEKTFAKISKLKTYTSKKLGNGVNADELIMLIVTKLTKFLGHLSDKCSQLMVRVFHVVLAIVEWNYQSIFNAVVDEGLNGKLRKHVLKLLHFYKNSEHLFCYVDNVSALEIEARPIRSDTDRI